MSERSPNKYSPSTAETQAALDRVNKAVEHAVNQKVGRLAQVCVALVHKLGDFDATVTEAELNGAAGWSMALEKLDQAILIKTTPPIEELDAMAKEMIELPPEPGDATSFLI